MVVQSVRHGRSYAGRDLIRHAAYLSLLRAANPHLVTEGLPDDCDRRLQGRDETSEGPHEASPNGTVKRRRWLSRWIGAYLCRSRSSAEAFGSQGISWFGDLLSAVPSGEGATCKQAPRDGVAAEIGTRCANNAPQTSGRIANRRRRQACPSIDWTGPVAGYMLAASRSCHGSRYTRRIGHWRKPHLPRDTTAA